MYLDKIGRPSIYFPSCMSLWGLILGLMGQFSHSSLNMINVNQNRDSKRVRSSFWVIQGVPAEVVVKLRRRCVGSFPLGIRRGCILLWRSIDFV